MARILAVDWDEEQARFVLGVALKDRLIILKAGSVSTPDLLSEDDESHDEVQTPELDESQDTVAREDNASDDEDDDAVEIVEKSVAPRMPVAFDDEEEEDYSVVVTPVENTRKGRGYRSSPLALALKKLLRDSRVGSATLCYCAERDDVEVMYMTAPQASETETPELVFNQALRDSLTFNETQPLDYMILGAQDGGKRSSVRRVVAVSIARDKLRRIRETLMGAYKAPSKIELRESALVEYLRTDFCGLSYEEPVLLIQELADEINLALCYRQNTLYVRSFKILSTLEPLERATRIKDEIVRTLAVGIDDLPEDEVVRQAVLFTDQVKRNSDSFDVVDENDDEL